MKQQDLSMWGGFKKATGTQYLGVTMAVLSLGMGAFLASMGAAWIALFAGLIGGFGIGVFLWQTGPTRWWRELAEETIDDIRKEVNG